MANPPPAESAALPMNWQPLTDAVPPTKQSPAQPPPQSALEIECVHQNVRHAGPDQGCEQCIDRILAVGEDRQRRAEERPGANACIVQARQGVNALRDRRGMRLEGAAHRVIKRGDRKGDLDIVHLP